MAQKKGVRFGSMIKPLIWGLLCCAISISLLFVIASLIISRFDVPIPSISTIVLVCAGISSFLGGYVSAKIYKRQGLIIGFLSGLLFALVIIICSLLEAGSLISVQNLIKYIVILVAAMLGGILGVNHRKKRR